MATRMLIDGRHPEETRVAVVKGNRIEEFDFEAAARQQIKGNIYLAKITRVEPSLQAAFVDYGGNRHGFLAFSEIHPDYYQIPKEDREALLREEQLLAEETARHDQDRADQDSADNGESDDFESEDMADDGNGEPPEKELVTIAGDVDGDENGDSDDNGDNGNGDDGDAAANGSSPEDHGNTEEAGAEALRRRRMALRRRYKIQEVIRRRQVMLVQVVKEERGNKGAALTTYISLAGRYSVLMPNTAHGGGISRKIANAADRKRLKAIMADIDLPRTMGAIIRTAGLERTRAEIRRDFDYLTRLWDEIREKTLSSSAPALIYEDSDLIKRAIRDIYTRDIDEVLIDGADAYQQARNFMRLLMPSHARKVKYYDDPVPLLHRAGVETQLAALMNPLVTLRSGGYIVINPTEALVAIDVNSGRSTREYNIEETALKTNIEAAEEVARQLRLRDLAGLVVVDFIDMEVHANNRKVERALKEALKSDRARIQVGRISAFGLLEMSRQRLRTGVLEASTGVCPTCDGLGLVRTPGSAALAALRLLEEDAVRGRASQFNLRTDREVAVYILNRKRAQLSELEERYGIVIEVTPDDSLLGGRIVIDASGPPPAQAPKRIGLAAPISDEPDDFDDYTDEEDEEASANGAAGGDGEQGHDGEGRDGRRRRRRRGGRGRGQDREQGREEEHAGASDESTAGDAEDEDGDGDVAASTENGENGEDGVRRRRRRRRRGGRGRETNGIEGATEEAAADAQPDDADTEAPDSAADDAGRPVTEHAAETVDAEAVAEVVAPPAEPMAEPVEAVAPTSEPVVEPAPQPLPEEPAAEAAPEAPEEAAAMAVGDAGDVVASVAGEAAAEAPPAEPEPAPKPAPKPRGRPRKKAVEPEAEAAEAVDGEAPAKPAPKPRGRPRKKAVEAETPEAVEAAARNAGDAGDVAAAVSKETTPDSEEKPAKPAPKPRGRPRKKVAEPAPAEPAAAAPAEAEGKSAAPTDATVKPDATAAPAQAEPVPDVAKVAKDQSTSNDGETGQDASSTEAEAEKPAEPRRGWWQRTFGD